MQHERACVVYKYALDHLPKDKCQEVYKFYTIHEKKYGDRRGIEDVIVSKRKFQYEGVRQFLWIQHNSSVSMYCCNKDAKDLEIWLMCGISVKKCL